MKIAVPTENGMVFPHFGHCPTFTFFEVDLETTEFRNIETLIPPPREQGVIPAWISRQGCTHIIAGGMGRKAMAMFEQNGVQVLPGTPEIKAEDAVKALLIGDLRTGSNPCNDPGFKRNGKANRQCHED